VELLDLGDSAAGAGLMAQFPAIEPLDRSYGLGAHPVSAPAFANGDETRFLHGALAFGVPMSLQFRKLNATDTQAIRDHYAAHSQARPFTIPAQLWRTHTTATDVVPVEFGWRYAAPPEETPISGGLFDVSVSLLSVD
jgi:hypothetical protein